MRVTIKCTIILVVVAVTACATQPRPVTDSTTQLQFVGFSVLPPQGKNWYFIGESQYSVRFAKLDHNNYKSGPNLTHTYLLSSYSDMVATGININNPERLLQFTENFLRQGNDTGRFRTLKLELTAFRRQESDCVQYDQIVKERDNPRFAAGAILTIIANGFICRNPFSPNWFTSAYYTERYIESEKVDDNKSFELESQIFLKNILLTPTPK